MRRSKNIYDLLAFLYGFGVGSIFAVFYLDFVVNKLTLSIPKIITFIILLILLTLSFFRSDKK